MDYIEKILEQIVYIVIFIKICFVLSIGFHFIFHYIHINKMLDEITVQLNDKIEFIYTLCMSLLLIFIFHPGFKHQKYISYHLGLLFFLYGIITTFLLFKSFIKKK